MENSTTRLVKYTPGPCVVHAAHESVTAFRNVWGRETRNCNFNVPTTLFGTQWSSLIYTLCTFLSQRELSSLQRSTEPAKPGTLLSHPAYIGLRLVSLLLLSYGTWQGAKVCVPFHSIQERRQGWDSATQLPLTFLRGSVGQCVGQFWADKALPHWFIIHSLVVKLKDTSI